MDQQPHAAQHRLSRSLIVITMVLLLLGGIAAQPFMEQYLVAQTTPVPPASLPQPAGESFFTASDALTLILSVLKTVLLIVLKLVVAILRFIVLMVRAMAGMLPM